MRLLPNCKSVRQEPNVSQGNSKQLNSVKEKVKRTACFAVRFLREKGTVAADAFSFCLQSRNAPMRQSLEGANFTRLANLPFPKLLYPSHSFQRGGGTPSCPSAATPFFFLLRKILLRNSITVNNTNAASKMKNVTIDSVKPCGQ